VVFIYLCPGGIESWHSISSFCCKINNFENFCIHCTALYSVGFFPLKNAIKYRFENRLVTFKYKICIELLSHVMTNEIKLSSCCYFTTLIAAEVYRVIGKYEA
jgi:hypothetical protein